MSSLVLNEEATKFVREHAKRNVISSSRHIQIKYDCDHLMMVTEALGLKLIEQGFGLCITCLREADKKAAVIKGVRP